MAPAVTQAATFTVTNTHDSGAGSLRAAIVSANADGVQDAITFASGVTGSIHLQSQLGIVNPLTIDTTGAGGAVTLDGSGIGGTIMNLGTPPGTLVGLTGLTFTHGGSSSPSVKGGAIKTFGADLRIHSSTLTGNTAGGGGGALYGSGSGTIVIDNGTQITDNVSGGDGGGVLTATQSGPSVEMHHTTVSGNQAAGSGGGVSLGDAAATLDQSVFDSNISGSTGGGINLRYGGAYLQNSTVSGNRAASGGGVHTFGTYFALIRTTLSGNDATGDGGGAFLDGYMTTATAVYDSTVAGNTAGGRGGGLARTVQVGGGRYAPLEVHESTIAGNRATTGAGGLDVIAPGSAVQNKLHSSIVACNSTENTSGADLRVAGGAAPFDTAFSLVQNAPASTMLNSGSNLFGQDPKLAALASNGGQNKTMALAAGSPAINNGDAALPADQRGLARGAGGADDIGAFERQPSDAVPSPAACDSHVGVAPTPQPIDSPTPLVPPAPGGPSVGKVAMSKLRVSSTSVTFTITCTSAGCSGNAVLSAVEKLNGKKLVGLAKIRKKRVRVGAKGYALAAGHKKKVTVKLNAAGRKLLRRYKKLPVTLIVSQKQATGNKVVKSAKVKLKAKKKRK